MGETNEQTCIRRVQQLMQDVEGVDIVRSADPEAEKEVTHGRSSKGVIDLWSVTDEGVNYYFEHTFLESFPDQLTFGTQFTDFIEVMNIDAVEKVLRDIGREVKYTLGIPVGVLEGHGGELNTIAEGLGNWICNMAPGMEEGDRITASPDGVPFQVTLSCWARSTEPVKYFGVRRRPPEDLQQKRVRVCLDRLHKKCPKLHAVKEDETSDQAILIFEVNDIALSNASVVATAVNEARASYTESLPDEIFVIESEAPKPEEWPVYKVL